MSVIDSSAAVDGIAIGEPDAGRRDQVLSIGQAIKDFVLHQKGSERTVSASAVTHILYFDEHDNEIRRRYISHPVIFMPPAEATGEQP